MNIIHKVIVYFLNISLTQINYKFKILFMMITFSLTSQYTGKLKTVVAFRWLQNEKVPAVAAARVQAIQNKLKRKRRKRKKKSSKINFLV